MEPSASNITQDHGAQQNLSLPETARAESPTTHHNITRPSIRTDNWKPMYPDVIESSPNLSDPNESPFEDLDRTATADELAPSRESPRKEAIQPEDILHVSAEGHNRRSALQNIPSKSVSTKETGSRKSDAGSYPASRNTRFGLQGKAKMHRASTSDATITKVIKTALVGGSIPDHGNGRSPLQDPEQSLSGRKTSSEDLSQSGPNPAVTSTGSDINPTGSPSASEYSIDFEAQRKAEEVLKSLHDSGYIVQKNPTHSTRSCNPGSVASSKSENLVTCQECGKFKGRPCELTYAITKPYLLFCSNLKKEAYEATLSTIRLHLSCLQQDFWQQE
jgi:hypothetical protein